MYKYMCVFVCLREKCCKQPLQEGKPPKRITASAPRYMDEWHDQYNPYRSSVRNHEKQSFTSYSLNYSAINYESGLL